MTTHDIGHGVLIWWDEDGRGFHWKHPACGHQLAAGSKSDTAALTIRGSLLCPKGCQTHGEIRGGRWHPC